MKKRPKKEKGKKTKPYVMRKGDRLNEDFYLGFDDSFLFNKADTLAFVVEEFEWFKAGVEGKGGDIDVPQKFLESLRAEIHMTEFQQAETLFALLLAFFQPLPHWLYLTTYQTGEIRKSIEKFLSGDIPGITGGKLQEPREFINFAVYAGFQSTELEKNQNWNTNLDKVIWLLQRIGSKYLEAGEYNAYKHGLRVVTGETRLAVYPDNRPDLAQLIAHSEDSLSFLELRDTGEGGNTVYLTTKHFNHYESYNHIFAMHRLLKTIRATRLARIKKEPKAELSTFFELDEDKLLSFSKREQWSFTV